MRAGPGPRTGFVYDMCPWKVVICSLRYKDCTLGHRGLVMIYDLPDPPEPLRVPQGADHVHIEKKFSDAADRDARENDKWRSLMKSVARCEHGKMMREGCHDCPKGVAPDETGSLVGFTSRGAEVRIPGYDDLEDIRAWVVAP